MRRSVPLDIHFIGTNYDGTTALSGVFGWLPAIGQGKSAVSIQSMTAQRQDRCVWRPQIAVIALLAVFCVLCNGIAGAAETTQRIVTDRFTGLAIEGFDPVAYFVNRHPVLGLSEFEASKEGVVWRFHNEGNRASFLAHPEIYGPRFGGYDPVDIARGITVAGNPRFWLVTGERLYLFGFEANRAAFASDPKSFLTKAQARWPSLERDLAQ